MWANGKALAGVMLIFLLGCFAGGLGTSAFFIHRNTVFLQRGAPAYLELLERRLSRGLVLDEDQKEKVHQIFLNNLAERKKLQAQIQPQVQDLNHDTLRQVKALLHPDQVETFDNNLEDFRRRFGRARFGVEPANSNSQRSQGDPTNATPDMPSTGP